MIQHSSTRDLRYREGCKSNNLHGYGSRPSPPRLPLPTLVSFLINLCCNELPPGDVLSSAPSEVGTRLESRLRGRKRAEMMQQKVGRDVPAAQDRLQFRTLSLLLFAQTLSPCYLNIHSFLALPFIYPI